jgi:hypothetical protein
VTGLDCSCGVEDIREGYPLSGGQGKEVLVGDADKVDRPGQRADNGTALGDLRMMYVYS